MTNAGRWAAAGCVCWSMFSSSTAGESQLTMRVMPVLSLEPALVTVSITVASDPENRSLEIVAETPDFRRSSEISLDGDRAPRLSTFQFRDLPRGSYEVTATLSGSRGERAKAIRTVVVVPGGGRLPKR